MFAVDEVPPLLLDQLKIKGRMVISVQAVLYCIERRDFSPRSSGPHVEDVAQSEDSREKESPGCALPGLDSRSYCGLL